MYQIGLHPEFETYKPVCEPFLVQQPTTIQRIQICSDSNSKRFSPSIDTHQINLSTSINNNTSTFTQYRFWTSIY